MSIVVEQVVETATGAAGVTTSHVISLPTATAGQLLIICLDKGSTISTMNAHASLTELLDENLANGLYIAYRWMDGTEPSTYTLVSTATIRTAALVYRLSGTANPAVQAPQIGTTSSGTSATPDPPASATPASSKEYLFIAIIGQAGEEADDDTEGNTSPTNYTPSPPRQKTAGTVGTNLGGAIYGAERLLTTGSAENPGTFGVDSNAAWRGQTIMVHPGPQAFVLDAQPGAFVITGVATGGGYGRFMNALPGSYAITGFATGALGTGRALNAQPGAFVVTGSVAGALTARVLNAQPGSVAITGAAMSAYRNYFLNASPGAIIVTGANIGALVDRVLNATPGSFVVTGNATGLLAARMINAAPGTFLVVGADTDLIYTPINTLTHYICSADPGSFGISGSVLGGGHDRILIAEPGNFEVTGSPTRFVAPIHVIPSPTTTGPVRKFIEENIGDIMAVRVARVELVSNSSGSASRRIRVDGSWLLAVKIDHNGSAAGCDVTISDADRTLLEITDSNTSGYYPVREEVVGSDGVGLGLFEPSVLTGNLVASMAQAGANKSVTVTVFYQ
jgi:hypothetical protein